MASDETGSVVQFRRQLIAVAVGAAVSMCSAFGVAVFEAQVRDKELRATRDAQLLADKRQSLDEFTAALYEVTAVQAKLARLIDSAVAVEVHAKAAVDKSDLAVFASVTAEADKVRAAYPELLAENGRVTGMLMRARQKMQAAFGDAPPLGIDPFPESFTSLLGSLGQPSKENVGQLAVGYHSTVSVLVGQYKANATWAKGLKDYVDRVTLGLGPPKPPQ
jgi:hypothetical protein